MNWRKFITESNELKNWLVTQGFEDADRILLKVIILIWRGLLLPEAILERAIQIPSLERAARDNLFTSAPTEMVLPEKITDIIIRWSYHLPRDSWLLGEIHERLATSRRTKGLFYTAPEIVDFILAHTVETADVVANPFVKILDPACGSGYFLLKAYDLLWRKFVNSRSALTEKNPEIDWSDDGIHRHIVAQNLWGADVDSVAVDLAAAGLLLKRLEANKDLQPNLLVCDSLRRPQEQTKNDDRAFWSASYDFVVGNPPYLSFGLRGAKRLDPDYENYLRQAFRASAEYKLSYYVLFMQRGIEMLTEGGRLGFIVPDSFLLGRYYSKIRHYILEHTAIEILAHIASPVFKNATVGMSAVCILTKQSIPENRDSQVMTIYQAKDKKDLLEKSSVCGYGQNYFSTLPFHRFRLFPDLTVKRLIDKIDNSSTPLVDFASGHSGIRSMTKQSDIVADFPCGEAWRPGLVSGVQVHRYGLVYSNHWLNIDPAMLYKGGWDPAIIGRRKILIRQTGYSLTACIDDNGFYHLNNIHSIVLKNQDIGLEYLLLLLNSRLMSFYYHTVTMEYGRAMAQTDIDTLELLPVRVEPEVKEQTVQLVGVMQDMVKRRLAGEVLTGKIAAWDDLLDQLVYRIYALTDEEIACVERNEARLATRRKNHRVREK